MKRIIYRVTSPDDRDVLGRLSRLTIDEDQFRQDLDTHSLDDHALYIPFQIEWQSVTDVDHLTGILDDMERKALYPDDISDWVGDGMFEQWLEHRNTDRISCGYGLIDSVLGGGFYSGMYCIAGDSGVGKTTLAWSMAYRMARSRDVVYVSLEQSKGDLVSKSVCALTGVALDDLDADKAGSALQTIKGTVGHRLHVHTAGYSTTVDDVIDIMDRYDRPIVFIDYLQAMTPSQDTKVFSFREGIDKMVHTFKDYARDHRAIIIVLSSVNRASYGKTASMDAIKESGGIEFSCDAVMGMYLSCIDDHVDTTRMKQAEIDEMMRLKLSAALREPFRGVTIKVLKTRNGSPQQGVTLKYNPSISTFKEVSIV